MAGFGPEWSSNLIYPTFLFNLHWTSMRVPTQVTMRYIEFHRVTMEIQVFFKPTIRRVAPQTPPGSPSEELNEPNPKRSKAS